MTSYVSIATHDGPQVTYTYATARDLLDELPNLLEGCDFACACLCDVPLHDSLNQALSFDWKRSRTLEPAMVRSRTCADRVPGYVTGWLINESVVLDIHDPDRWPSCHQIILPLHHQRYTHWSG